MGFAEKSGGIPPLPSSLNANANAWEMVDLGDGQHTEPLKRPYPDTDPIVTPYLGLRARLSQLWFNRWTVLLLLVLVRVLLLTASLDENLADAKLKALSACTKVEDIGSAVASMPHYLSVGVNSLAADTITNMVSGMVKMLNMIVTGVKNLLLFIINMYIGTYACLIAGFIHGSLDVAADVVEGATKKFNDFIDPLTNEVADKIAEIKTEVGGIVDKVIPGTGDSNELDNIKDELDSIGDLFSRQILAFEPRDTDSALDKIRNFKLDTADFVKDIVQLNQTIPTFDEAEELTKGLVSKPFDEVHRLIGVAYGNWTFDKALLPVADKEALTFCSSNSFINDFFAKLVEIVANAKIAFIVVIIILAIGAIVAMGYLEIRRWRREKERARTFTEHGYDPMDVVYMASRPFTSGIGVKLASKFRSNERRYLLVRWAIAYGTSLPALFVLSLAIAGFFSCFCQYILLRSIQKEAPALATEVGNFAGAVVNTLEDVSTGWASDANQVVVNLQDEINNNVFGWVVNATTAVNDTLNAFDEQIDKILNDVFKDTVLMPTVQIIVGCVITRKIETIEKGLTWVRDSAQVTLPLLPNDTFSQGAEASVQGDSDLTSFLASPASVTTDEISSAVNKVIDSLRSSIIQEALISTALLLVYVIVVMMGVVRTLVSMTLGREKTRAEGGHRYNITHPTHLHHRPPPPPPTTTRAQQDEASPSYDDVVYAGRVPRGKTGLVSSTHLRKSSYPEWEGDDGHARYAR